MARILAIDYGLKRTGLAVTDPLQIIATGLTTIESPKLIAFLKDYFKKEEVELILVGEPKNWDDTDTHATPLVRQIVKRLEKEFPAIPLKMADERYTSKMASAWSRLFSGSRVGRYSWLIQPVNPRSAMVCATKW